MHVESLEEREWIANEHERLLSQKIGSDEKLEIAKIMLISQNFDNFVGSKFPSVKRYGGEGAESCMPFYQEIFKLASADETDHVFLCMAHRGRLNLLTGLLNLPPELMFSKMKGRSELSPTSKGFINSNLTLNLNLILSEIIIGIGDVLSHLTSVTNLRFGDKSVTVSMLPNPSHLEAANPFTAGRTRAEQQWYFKFCCCVITEGSQNKTKNRLRVFDTLDCYKSFIITKHLEPTKNFKESWIIPLTMLKITENLRIDWRISKKPGIHRRITEIFDFQSRKTKSALRESS